MHSYNCLGPLHSRYNYYLSIDLAHTFCIVSTLSWSGLLPTSDSKRCHAVTCKLQPPIVKTRIIASMKRQIMQWILPVVPKRLYHHQTHREDVCRYHDSFIWCRKWIYVGFGTNVSAIIFTRSNKFSAKMQSNWICITAWDHSIPGTITIYPYILNIPFVSYQH